jgi:hypothetical protein
MFEELLNRFDLFELDGPLAKQQPSGRPDGVAGQSLPPLKVHTKAIQALSRADGRCYFLPVVELPVILTPGEDGYIDAKCPKRPDFSGFPYYLVAMMEVR